MKKLEIIHDKYGTFGVKTQNHGSNFLSLPEVLKKVTEFCLEEVKPEIYYPPKDTLVDLLDGEGNVVATRYATGEKSKDGISLYRNEFILTSELIDNQMGILNTYIELGGTMQSILYRVSINKTNTIQR